ncbi:tetratricopeptide repeat protein [Scytonema sp. NUACC21]
MKRILVSFLVFGIGLTPMTVPFMVESSWAQIRSPAVIKAKQLLEQAKQQSQQGQFQQAIQILQYALAIFRDEKSPSWEATTLNDIGKLYLKSGEAQVALEYLNQALAIRTQLGDNSAIGRTLSYIGDAYKDLQKTQSALDSYKKALEIFKTEKSPSWEATTLNDIGDLYVETGKVQIALEYYNQELEIRKQLSDRSDEATTLNNIGFAHLAIGQFQTALDVGKEALKIAETLDERSEEAKAQFLIGFTYNGIGQTQKALNSFKEAVSIFRELKDASGEAATLIFLGFIEEQPTKVIEYLNQALPLTRQLKSPIEEATLLSWIGISYITNEELEKGLSYLNQALLISKRVENSLVETNVIQGLGAYYYKNKQLQKALESFTQVLQIYQTINLIAGKAEFLAIIGLIHQNLNQPAEAIVNLEQAAELTLKTRGSLRRDNKEKTRQKFLEFKGIITIPLVKLLIEQKQYDKAYEWVNRATTADLADYTRLVNVKIENPEAQKAIDEWNQKNKQLDSLQQNLNLPNQFSNAAAQQIRLVEAEVITKAEEISRRFPEIAEIFEAKPKDIATLRANIPIGTVVVQPVLLTDTTDIPDAVAIFVLTRDDLTVKKVVIKANEFDTLVTKYREQLANPTDPDFINTREELYDILIRPVESEIRAASPTQLSIIATGKLRYIPFETLYDNKTEKYLIEKYPVNYLTRLSTHSLQQQVNRNKSTLSVLAFGNPLPTPDNLSGAEAEVNQLTKIFPGSKAYLREKATLETFKTQALRFPILHLGTHGCFKLGGCFNRKMEENTLLFANNQKYNIADAALLGLKNTELITLTACQTAKEADANSEEISGLAYIFERAGAKSVIASLWNAEDKTSQEIIIQFYQNLKNGMSKGEALRQAKINQIKLNPDLHPFNWSPLILIGDAR